MREYAKVGPKMWHGQTIKALRQRALARGSEGASKGSEGVIVALYLMTSPSSNMLGLFTQPILYMAHETGLGEQGALKGLQDCVEVGFCSYDRATEVVWVHEMARYQVAPELKATDLRCKGIQKDYEALPDNPFLGDFFDRYGKAFHLALKREPRSPSKGACLAPSKPLRSQEQEQEQEQEKEQEQAQEQDRGALQPPGPPAFALTPAAPPPAAAPPRAPKPPGPAPAPKPPRKAADPKAELPTVGTWNAYSRAYAVRYHTDPLRNAMVNGQLANLVARLGAEAAPAVAAFYVRSNNARYVGAGHSVAMLLMDAEKLHTEWKTGQQGTHTQARLADRAQSNLNSFAPLIEEARAKQRSEHEHGHT